MSIGYKFFGMYWYFLCVLKQNFGNFWKLFLWPYSKYVLALLDKRQNWCYICCSVTQLCPTLSDPVDCSSPSFPILHYLQLLSPPLFMPLIFPSIRVLFTDSAVCIKWPKNWSFSFNTIHWIFRVDFLLGWLVWSPAVQGTLKSLLFQTPQLESILWQSAFFMVQLSHPYMTTGEIITVTIWAFVDKVISLLLNTLSGLVIAFLPRSKHLLISWLQSLSAVMLELEKTKSVTVFIFFPIYLPWSDGTVCHDLSFWNVEF